MVDSSDNSYRDHKRIHQARRKEAELELIGQQAWVMEVHGGSDARKTRLYTEAGAWVEQATHDIGGVASHLQQNIDSDKNLWVMRNEEPLYGKGNKLANRHGVHRIKTFIDNFAGTNPKYPYFKSFEIIVHAPENERVALLEEFGINEKLIEMRAGVGRPIIFKDENDRRIDVNFSLPSLELPPEIGVALHRDDPAVEKPLGWKAIVQPPLKGFTNEVGRVLPQNMRGEDTGESPAARRARMSRNRRNQQGPTFPGL